MSVYGNIFEIQKSIGERIQKERRAIRQNGKTMTQAELSEYMDCARTTVVSWESGNSCPTIPELRKLSQLFHCDVQYLLCEQECRTREQADMQDALGLSKKAIENICNLREASTDMQPNGTAIFALNKMLESPNIMYLLSDIGIFLQNLKMRDAESIPYYQSTDFLNEIQSEFQSERDFLSGKPVTLSNRQYQEYWEQHTTREIMNFLQDVAKKVENDDDWLFPISINKED